MPIRNLSEKIVEKEQKKTFNIKLNSEEKKDLKNLLKKRKDLKKDVTKNLSINDSLEIKLTGMDDEHYFDEYIVMYDGEDLNLLEMTYFDDIVKKKDGPALTETDEILMKLWNSVVSYGYDHTETLASIRILSDQIRQRNLMILDLSKEFASFFKAIEKRTESAGLFKRLLDLDVSEVYEMIEALKKGHEVEIY